MLRPPVEVVCVFPDPEIGVSVQEEESANPELISKNS